MPQKDSSQIVVIACLRGVRNERQSHLIIRRNEMASSAHTQGLPSRFAMTDATIWNAPKRILFDYANI